MTFTLWLANLNAAICGGSGSSLNGIRFACCGAVSIDPRPILADPNIMDTNIHSPCIDCHYPEALVRADPIALGQDVWVAGEAGILPGTSIGDNLVVGLGAICTGRSPANVLTAGNPAKVLRGLDDVQSK